MLSLCFKLVFIDGGGVSHCSQFRYGEILPKKEMKSLCLPISDEKIETRIKLNPVRCSVHFRHDDSVRK